MRVTVIGANGFVGSALVGYLKSWSDVELIAVTRQNYEAFKKSPSDIVIEVSGNSKKFLADNDPLKELDLSVGHRLQTLLDFPAAFHVHVSSVDVYSDLTSPDQTREESPIDLRLTSHYGAHKLLAEGLVQHYASKWLIVRLGGMIGKNLRKNPVYDILHHQPLRIHPDSQYQFIRTAEVARAVWLLMLREVNGQVYNVCGSGLISPRQIAGIAGKEIDLSQVSKDAKPRVVNVNNEKIRQLTNVESSHDAVTQFIEEFQKQPPAK